MTISISKTTACAFTFHFYRFASWTSTTCDHRKSVCRMTSMAVMKLFLETISLWRIPRILSQFPLRQSIYNWHTEYHIGAALPLFFFTNQYNTQKFPSPNFATRSYLILQFLTRKMCNYILRREYLTDFLLAIFSLRNSKWVCAPNWGRRTLETLHVPRLKNNYRFSHWIEKRCTHTRHGFFFPSSRSNPFSNARGDSLSPATSCEIL